MALKIPLLVSLLMGLALSAAAQSSLLPGTQTEISASPSAEEILTALREPISQSTSDPRGAAALEAGLELLANDPSVREVSSDKTEAYLATQVLGSTIRETELRALANADGELFKVLAASAQEDPELSDVSNDFLFMVLTAPKFARPLIESKLEAEGVVYPISVDGPEIPLPANRGLPALYNYLAKALDLSGDDFARALGRVADYHEVVTASTIVDTAQNQESLLKGALLAGTASEDIGVSLRSAVTLLEITPSDQFLELSSIIATRENEEVRSIGAAAIDVADEIPTSDLFLD